MNGSDLDCLNFGFMFRTVSYRVSCICIIVDEEQVQRTWPRWSVALTGRMRRYAPQHRGVPELTCVLLRCPLVGTVPEDLAQAPGSTLLSCPCAAACEALGGLYFTCDLRLAPDPLTYLSLRMALSPAVNGRKAKGAHNPLGSCAPRHQIAGAIRRLYPASFVGRFRLPLADEVRHAFWGRPRLVAHFSELHP